MRPCRHDNPLGECELCIEEAANGPVTPRTDRLGRSLEDRAAQHRTGAEHHRIPDAPVTKPMPHIPTAQVAPPVHDMLQDVLALCHNHLTKLKATGLTTPKDAQMLEGVAKTVQLVHNLDRQMRKELEDEFGKMTEEQLAAKLRGES